MKNCLPERGTILSSKDVPRRISETCIDCAFPSTVWEENILVSGCLVQDTSHIGNDLGKITSTVERDPNSYSWSTLGHIGITTSTVNCRHLATLTWCHLLFIHFMGAFLKNYSLPSHIILLKIKRGAHCTSTENSGFCDTYFLSQNKKFDNCVTWVKVNGSVSSADKISFLRL